MAYRDLVAMVVDDFEMMRGLVRNILKDLRFKAILEAENGAEAIKLLKSHKVDVILADWNMPVMTGLQLLKSVRADERLKGVPFLMVTAEAQEENILEAVKAKVSDYVIKPFSAAALAEKLAKIIPEN